MTRTLVDIFITLHYIANKDADSRAMLYYQYFAKDTEEWGEVIKHFWPNMAIQPIAPRTKKLASDYHRPHSWSGKPVSQMALEPDTIEIDEVTGKPIIHEFAYFGTYRWTSHYVHPTVVALKNHLVTAGTDNFVVHSGNIQNMKGMAVFNIAMYLSQTMVCFYRCMKDPQPKRVGPWGCFDKAPSPPTRLSKLRS